MSLIIEHKLGLTDSSITYYMVFKNYGISFGGEKL